MSPARPAAAVSRWLAASSASASASCHHFHSSARLTARRKPRFQNIRAAELGLVSDKQVEEFAQKKFKNYTQAEKEELAKRFSPEQIVALEAGEATIDPKDLTIQGRLRMDPYRMPYIDDFADYQPIIDRRPRTAPPADPRAKFMSIDEMSADIFKWAEEKLKEVEKLEEKKLELFVSDKWKGQPVVEWPEDVREAALVAQTQHIEEITRAKENPADHGNLTGADLLEFWDRNVMTHGDVGGHDFTAPALPNKVPGVAGLYRKAIDPEDEGRDDTGIYTNLKRTMNMTLNDIRSIRIKLIFAHVVHNQTRLGKVRRAAIWTVAGNENGWLGIGHAKAVEFKEAKQKAEILAIRNMKPIPRYENRTIYGNTEAKFGATVVQLFARPPGFGLRCSHRIFEMARLAGIRDLSARMPRGRNPMNSIKAMYAALMKQRDPEDIAIGRGRKMVDVRKVYYGGAVY